MAPIIAVIVGVSGLVLFFGLIYLGEAHEAKPWVTTRARLMELAQEYGLEIEPSGTRARGELEGLSFSLGVTSLRRGKSKIVNLWAKLEVPDCPPSMELREEDLLSGVGRTFGTEELSLGDPEFDAAFEIGGSSVDEVKQFLTPGNRGGLLRYMPRLPQAHLKLGVISSEKSFSTPFFMEGHAQNMLENYRLLATALQGRGEPLEEGASSGLIERKLRRFAGWTLWVWFLLFLLTLTDRANDGSALQALLLLGTVLTAATFSASEISRVILQGFYAFMSLSILGLIGLGFVDGLEIYNVPWLRLVDDEYIAFFLFNTVFMFGFWGARNYLRTLDRSRVVVRDAAGARPQV